MTAPIHTALLNPVQRGAAARNQEVPSRHAEASEPAEGSVFDDRFGEVNTGFNSKDVSMYTSFIIIL